MATRQQIDARNRATAKRLAAINGRDPITASRRLDARELFAVLSAKREESRPVTQERVVIGHDKLGRKRTQLQEVKGAPTFRNVIVDGAWV